MLQKRGVLSIIGLLAHYVAADSASAVATSCNPIKTTGCSPDTALAGSFAEDFTSESNWFSSEGNPGNITYGSEGLALTLGKRFDNPGVESDFYIMFGKVEVELKAAPGTGVVSSFFLQSDDLDEIDIEWVGSDNTQYQSNFFSKGDTTTYDRGAFHGVDAPVDKFHNYTLEWGVDQTVWYLDGQVSRTLLNSSSEGYPQTPMKLKIGIWAGGDPSNAPGTIEWAGGEIDYTQAPFTMYVKRLVVTDYSTGSEYSYNGQSGSWESIEANDGSVNGRYDQAQEDFATLVGGGEITSSASSSSSSSSVSSSTSASSSSSVSSSSSSTSASSSSSVSSSSSSTSASSSSSVSSSSSSSSVSSSSSLSSASSSSSSSSETTTSTASDSNSTTSSSSMISPSPSSSGPTATSSTKTESRSQTESSSAPSATTETPISTSSPATTTEATDATHAVTSSTLSTKISTSDASSSAASIIPNENKAMNFGLPQNLFAFLAIMGAAIAF